MAETAKIRVVVMYGGKADEHSISCISAAGRAARVSTDKFEALRWESPRTASGS